MNAFMLVIVLAGSDGTPIQAELGSMKACRHALYEATVREPVRAKSGYCLDTLTGRMVVPYDLNRKDSF